MKRLLLSVAALLGIAVLNARNIPADPGFKVGRLDNDMTYYLYHNSTPKGCAEFYIAHNVGALQEEDNQNGLAHFLEHMAFNGTRHYPGKEILNFLAAEGVRFGYNVNAFTTKSETVYNLSAVPLVRDSFIDSVLMVLHDWSCDISCEQQALDDERGVISEEWRLSQDSRSRMAEQQSKLIYRGSKQAERNVIGTLEVINGFKREEILDFYHKWYRPDLQAIIVVGDFELSEMERRIRRLFSDIPAVANPQPKGEYVPPAITAPLYADMTDHEIKYQAFKAIYRQDFIVKDRSSEAFYKDELCRAIITSVLGDRLKEACRAKGSAIQNATLVTNVYRPDMYVSMATVMPRKKTDLPESLRFIERQVKSLLEYGISEDELQVAKLNLAQRMHLNSESEESQTPSAAYVNVALGNFLQGGPLSSPEQMRQLRRDLLAAITLEDVAPYPGYMFGESGKILSNCYNNVEEPGLAPSMEQMQAIVAEVGSEAAERRFLEYPDVNLDIDLPSGRILTEGKAKGTDMELWKLSNGAKVYYKHAEPERRSDNLVMTWLFDTGYKMFRSEDASIVRYALSYAKRNAGIRDCIKPDFKNYPELSGIKLMLSGGARQARFEISSDASKAENAFKAANLQMREPYFGSERQLEQAKSASLKSMGKKKSPQNLFDERVRSEAYGNHPWMQEMDSAAVSSVCMATVADAFRRYWGNPQALSVVICSDLDRSQIRSLVEKYIASIQMEYPYPAGSLEPISPALGGGMDIRENAEAAAAPFSQVSWNRYFYGDVSIKERATIDILDYIMSNRYLNLVREERGGAYSISFHSAVSEQAQLPNQSYIEFRTRPEMLELVLGDLDGELERMCTGGPTGLEMENAVKYLVKHFYEKQDRIGHSVLLQQTQMLDWVRAGIPYGYDYEKAVRSVRPADIMRLARRIASGERLLTVYTEE